MTYRKVNRDCGFRGPFLRLFYLGRDRHETGKQIDFDGIGAGLAPRRAAA